MTAMVTAIWSARTSGMAGNEPAFATTPRLFDFGSGDEEYREVGWLTIRTAFSMKGFKGMAACVTFWRCSNTENRFFLFGWTARAFMSFRSFEGSCSVACCTVAQ